MFSIIGITGRVEHWIRPPLEWDLLTLTAVAAVLAAFAFLASYIPARRAASINPVEALRTE
jgi:ABC-type lipoprotein release transport system permease subunit